MYLPSINHKLKRGDCYLLFTECSASSNKNYVTFGFFSLNTWLTPFSLRSLLLLGLSPISWRWSRKEYAMEIRWLWSWLLFCGFVSTIECSSSDSEDTPKSRQKRLVWVTDDGRLALPPGTSLTISPTIAMPFVRYPPDGFFSNISISLPLTSKESSHSLFGH